MSTVGQNDSRGSVGAWERGSYIGCIIFSYGANNNAAKSFDLSQQQCCELTRVALTEHEASVSRMLSIATKMLKRQCPGLKLAFSYADKTNQGHHGGIYQAAGWIYLGERTTGAKGAYYFIHGKKMHGRSARAKYGSEKRFPVGWRHAPSETKHLYVKLLDRAYTLSKAIYRYPKRAGSIAVDAPVNHTGEGGSTPTPAL